MSHDVIVVGGGPAGSTVAALVAEAGYRTLVLEREEFPRFRIGESLMPATYWSFERLGVLDALHESDFPRKHSVQFVTKAGKATRPYYFSAVEPAQSASTWQVERSRLDQILLGNAAAKGAEVRYRVSVRDVLLDGNRAVGVLAEDAEGRREELRCQVVVDATGQSALLARKLRLRRADRNLLHQSFFTRFTGAWRAEGIDEGATLILHTSAAESWFWYIPLPDDTVSVGVVAPIEYLVKGRPNDPQAVFDEEVARCRSLQERIAGARQIGPVRALKDFSYCAESIAGHGWVLAGDAFGFIDPIYSSGVFLALKGGEMAADSIVDALKTGDPSAARLGRHGPELVAGMEAIRKMVYAFYEPEFSFADFLRQHPECEKDVVHLLIGNVFRRPADRLLAAMDEYCELPDYRTLRMDPAAVAEGDSR